MIIITDDNIHELVRTYFENPPELPEDLRNISEWDVSRVTDMSELFKNVEGYFLQSLNDWDVSNVTTMEGMFYETTNFDNRNRPEHM